MKNLLKLAVLFIVFSIFISCESLYSCPDGSKNLGNNIKFGKYISDFSQPHPDGGYSVRGTQEFIFREDGSFSYIRVTIPRNKIVEDTIIKLDGKFKTYQDLGYPWYVLKLEADSIYEKKMKSYTANNPSYFTENFISEEFSGFNDSLISDIDIESNCFSLAYKTNPSHWDDDLPNIVIYCDKTIIREIRTFCLKQPEEEQNLIGDDL